MRILIDCDGVLSDFNKMILKMVKDQFNIDLRLVNGNEWDCLEYPEVKHVKGQIWDHLLGTKGLIRNLEKFDYADKLIAGLRQRGEVIACTSLVKGEYYACERIEWLIEEMGFDRKDIILAYKKHICKGDVFIDDKPQNVTDWANAYPEGFPVLWQSPGKPLACKYKNIFLTRSCQELFYNLDGMTEW